MARHGVWFWSVDDSMAFVLPLTRKLKEHQGACFVLIGFIPPRPERRNASLGLAEPWLREPGATEPMA